MHSKRSLEGYLLISNEHAPAVPVEWAAKSGKGTVGAGVQGVQELATLTCSHCHRQMVVQPLRTRERPYCRKCDHYICDDCAVVAKLNGGECRSLRTLIDRLQESAATTPLILKDT